jgi:acyl transferase domain-containing protein/NAD(P)-dependent dehydrogenase (short-subunit alcohol dehydrogenase family)/acyl carrier protein/SAM-dependent methyltransferase
MNILHRAGFLSEAGDSFVATDRWRDPHILEILDNLSTHANRTATATPFLRPYVKLLWYCVQAYPSVLSGRKSPLDILFPGGSFARVRGVYQGNPVSDYYNAWAGAFVNDYITRRLEADPGAIIRILEAGAGIGATTGPVLDSISAHRANIRYVYTDLSPRFLQLGEEAYKARHPFLDFQLLDLESSPEEQGFQRNRFDLVLAANAFHAVRRIDDALDRIKRLLKANGVLLLIESVAPTIFQTLTFGLTKEWWAYEDKAVRVEDSPLVSPPMWKRLLSRAGFRKAQTHRRSGEAFGEESFGGADQCAILAESDGIVIVESKKANHPEVEAPAPKLHDRSTKPMPSHPHAGVRDMPAIANANLLERVKVYLRSVLAELLKASPSAIEDDENLAVYGLDSLLALEANQRFAVDLGFRPPATLLFQNGTVQRLADYLLESKRDLLERTFAAVDNATVGKAPGNSPDRETGAPAAHGPANRWEAPGRPSGEDASASDSGGERRGVAIIGMAGRYPGAPTLGDFWENLKAGRISFREVPSDRWDWRRFHRPFPNAIGEAYCKVGGFIEGVDRFDPLFFNISPAEAVKMDPQERLFLEIAWETLEDAGYTRRGLAGEDHRVGVFVGAMNCNYEWLAGEAHARGVRSEAMSAFWSIANRVSYVFDFQGPSIAVDTACSASLTAIHLACRSIRSGECRAAIAGGVNLILHPMHFSRLCRAEMLSREGVCRSFGQGADGFVDGEGVGAVLLKPLEKAVEDGDRIYAVIRGSAVNAGGRTGGYSAPNPNAQARVVLDALDDAGIAPETIGYVEAHGTGTPLGDPLEIAGLIDAYRKRTKRSRFCAIGSVKSNIGHLESAAGIAALTKATLQMRHGMLAPSLNGLPQNKELSIEGSPFYIQHSLAPWPRPVAVSQDGNKEERPRRCGISSFGAGGANAHLILEEHPARDAARPFTRDARRLIVLSARDRERLQAVAKRLKGFLDRAGAEEVRLDDVAYTLQTGREAMAERLAFVAGSVEEAKSALVAFLESGPAAHAIWTGRADSGAGGDGIASPEEIDACIAGRDQEALARAWVRGAKVQWGRLYDDLDRASRPCRISLPTYPFATERYWIPDSPDESPALRRVSPPGVHPLIEANISTVDAVRFRKIFRPGDFYIKEHVIHGERLAPAAICLEMARAAGALALDGRPVKSIHDVVWCSPIKIEEDKETLITLHPEEGGLRYKISSDGEDGRDRTVHGEGRLLCGDAPTARAEAPTRMEIEEIRNRCAIEEKGEECYRAYRSLGYDYGPAFQLIGKLWRNDREALAELRSPQGEAWRRDEFAAGAKEGDSSAGAFAIDPILVDAAMQTAILLVAGGPGRPATAGEEWLPWGLEEFRPAALPPSDIRYAYVGMGPGPASGSGLAKRLDIVLTAADGRIACELRGLTVKRRTAAGDGIELPASAQTMLVAEEWGPDPLPDLRPGSGRPIKTLLLFGADRDLCERIKDRFAGTARIATVLPGEEFGPAGEDVFFIRPRHEEDYDRLMRELSRSGFAFDCAVYVWGPEAAEDVSGCLETLPYSILAITRGLMRVRPENEVRMLCAGLIPTAPADGPAPVFEALAGFARALQIEDPRIAMKVVRVRAGRGLDGDIGEIVRSELLTGWDGDAAVERAASRRKRTLVEVEDAPKAPLPFPNDGAVVITGGMGGLGLAFADYFTRERHMDVALIGRSPLDAAREEKLRRIECSGARALYIEADAASRPQLEEALDAVRKRFGKIGGIIHGAGQLRDGFMRDKTREQMEAVVQPKARGAVNLDALTRDDPLDFFVLFSSVASVFGNAGQADYAYANSFLDHFAGWRENLRRLGKRSGASVSINWPLWDAGGMDVPPDTRRWMREDMGLQPLESRSGIMAFEAAMRTGRQQVMVLRGDREKVLERFAITRREAARQAAGTAPRDAAPNSPAVEEAARSYLRRLLSKHLGLVADDAKIDLPFESFGADSIRVRAMIRDMEKDFGPLPKTLFYEYANLRDLARWIAENHAGGLPPGAGKQEALEKSGEGREDGGKPFEGPFLAARSASPSGDIAIIGLAGRYPKARTVEEFWENLKSGRDCIESIPEERWDHRRYFHPDKRRRGSSYSHWGGFLDGVDRFDASFFHITPREAELLDPQERLFLEVAWETFENAGWTRKSLARFDVGVFAGVMQAEYQLYGPASEAAGKVVAPVSSHASIANRVSYWMDLHGPSMAVDSMCSSSLTAIHLACQSIRSGECAMALAGGVNLSLHPIKYIQLCERLFASSDGRCRSFGAGGDGYVPGEGAGAVLLRPLADALRDGDHIHGVIKATAVNHGGRSNGYSAPNPRFQAEVIRKALERGGVDPSTIGYVEAHGTGTALGDPAEIRGLADAYGSHAREMQYCAIGSVKSNIGHLEAAAGIAGLTKVLLQMRHGMIAPSIHSEEINPDIDFASTPFRLQRRLEPWTASAPGGETGERPAPRRAAVSAFGAGGSNAHMIVEEFAERRPDRKQLTHPQLVVLSAPDQERLRAYAGRIAEFLRSSGPVSLEDLAYTLRTGREAMEVRLALVVEKSDALAEKLLAFAEGESGIEGLFTGGAELSRRLVSPPNGVEIEAAARSPEKLKRFAMLWASGADMDWESMDPGFGRKRIPLPAYPFRQERHWAPGARGASLYPAEATPKRLHPLAGSGALAPGGSAFTVRLSGAEPFLADHRVQQRKILPAGAYIEMARAAGDVAAGKPVTRIRDMAWTSPLVVEAPVDVLMRLEAEGNGAFFEAGVEDGAGSRKSHAQARLFYDRPEEASPHRDVEALRNRLPERIGGDSCYQRFHENGFDYGPSLRVISEVCGDGREVLARLELPVEAREPGGGEYVLHPALLDGAIQASAGLFPEREDGAAFLPCSVDEILICGRLDERCRAHAKMAQANGSGDSRVRLDVDLLNERGAPLVMLKGLCFAPAFPAGMRAPSEIGGAEENESRERGASQKRDALEEEAIRRIRLIISDETKLPPERIGLTRPFQDFGIESAMVMRLIRELEKTFGLLPKTLFYEYRTVADLARYFRKNRAERLAGIARAEHPAPSGEMHSLASKPASVAAIKANGPSQTNWLPVERRSDQEAPRRGVAVIGMSGSYPMAPDLDAFWSNLAEGRDCIAQAPPARRNSMDSLHSAAEKTVWGGFLDGVDEFDPGFFHISPRDAELMDPQERLFLQAAWHALEDAGYTPTGLKGKRVGVYVGVMHSPYQLLGVEASLAGAPIAAGSSPATIANRVSYHLDLNGPSIALDTMCSSSLTAIHLACEAIRSGDADMAVAGGVNLLLHASQHYRLNRWGFTATGRRCRSFGKGGDGYAPGEGVGVIVLKSLECAEADGDPIYAVIRSTWMNHGGHTDGFTVPNPNAQAELIREAVRRSGVSPSAIGYIEAHGTGTALGDPIEVAGMARAFEGASTPPRRLPIGSVKSNIGHLESAAGIAAITKVLLQLQHRRLAPSLHSRERNPNIDFGHTPFLVQQELEDWPRPAVAAGEAQRPAPRAAGVSSFGAGGANVHVVLEEHKERAVLLRSEPVEQTELVILSAVDDARLREYAKRLLRWLEDRDAGRATESSRSTGAGKPSGNGNGDGKPDAAHLHLREDIRDGLAEAFSKVLCLEAAELKPSDDLCAYGVTRYHISAAGEEMEARFGLENAARTMMRHASIETMARALLNGNGKRREGDGARPVAQMHAASDFPKAPPSLADIAHTLRVGRVALDARLAMLAASIPELMETLREFLEGNPQRPGAFHGNAEEGRIGVEAMLDDEDGRSLVERWAAEGRLDRLARLWALGAEIDWEKLPWERHGRRVRLPGYPFAKERYWIPSVSPLPLEAKAPRNAGPPEKKENSAPIHYLRPIWNAEKGERGEPVRVALVFAPDEKTGREVREVLTREPAGGNPPKIVLVLPGSAYVETDDLDFRIDPVVEEHYLRLYGRLQSEGSLPERIVHLWAEHEAPPLSLEASPHSMDMGIRSIFLLAKALSAKGSGQECEILFFHPEDRGSPLVESASGFGLSLGQAIPGVKLSTVRYQPDQPGVLSQCVRAELFTKRGRQETEIAYSSGVGARSVRRLAPADMEGPAPGRIREGGVYLIAGGLGALGRLVAERLVLKYNARVALLGRSRPDGAGAAFLDGLRSRGTEIAYFQADVADAEAMSRVVEETQCRYGAINGVFHAAGGIGETPAPRMDFADFAEGLKSKISGTMVLDRCTRNAPLDFFCLFSSISSYLGDFGQCSYAIGARRQDAYACLREKLRKNGERSGASVSVNWGFWKDGGLHFDPESESMYLKATGMDYIDSPAGLDALERILAGNEPVVLCAAGEKEKITKLFHVLTPEIDLEAPSADIQAAAAPPAEEGGPGPLDKHTLASLVREEITRLAAEELKLDARTIQPGKNLGHFGFDSLTMKSWAAAMSARYGVDLPPTLFFSRTTIQAVTAHIVERHPDAARRLHSVQARVVGDEHRARQSRMNAPAVLLERVDAPSEAAGIQGAAPRNEDRAAVAVVGMSGIFPGAPDIAAFWENLVNERCSVGEIPPERWDWREYYAPDFAERNKTNSRWGGFIQGMDRFDAEFFGMSPSEAMLTDPQQRLFLQTAWRAIEDAGYRASALSGARAGVFVGAQFDDYHRMLADLELRRPQMASGNVHAMIANRVSYFFNFKGPSEAINTACSSSLAAIHRAASSVASGESEMAIAGGVSLMLLPEGFVGVSHLGILSPDGKCRTFDKNANGYVRGEGVAAVVLKPLQRAIEDGDHIYAVIRASGVNHGGRGVSLTAPNPDAQAELLASVYASAGWPPGSISFIELHGTATELGDSVEAEALKRAFRAMAEREGTGELSSGYCALGSVKTNIGHLEPAAGVAGFIKAALAVEKGIIPASLHFEEPNPLCGLAGSPFHVASGTVPWTRLLDGCGRPLPRRCGISSFGFGGANAHVALEEYSPPAGNGISEPAEPGPQLFPLSARTREQLEEYCRGLLNFLEKGRRGLSFSDVAYTLQVGREPMAVRLAVAASTWDDLMEGLESFLGGPENQRTFHGSIAEGHSGSAVDIGRKASRPEAIAEAWTRGAEVEWRALHGGRERAPRRVSLPTYPFALKRYWLTDLADGDGMDSPGAKGSKPSTGGRGPGPVLTIVQPRWVEDGRHEPGGPARESEMRPGAVFIAGPPGADGLSRALAHLHRERRVVFARTGGRTRQLGAGEWEIGSDDPSAFEPCLAAMQTLGGVYFLGGAPDQGRGPAERPEQSVLLLFRLLKTLAKRGMMGNGPRIRVIVDNAHSVLPGEKASPHSAGLIGLSQSIAREHPDADIAVVDVDAKEAESSPGALAEAIVRERRDAAGRRAALRKGRRYIQELFPLDIATQSRSAFRESGIYLILGGAGGIGQALSMHLAKHYRARLAWVGRRDLDKSIEDKMTAVRAAGGDAIYIRADALDPEAMREAVRRTLSAYGGIDGAVHSAVTLADCALETMDEARFKAAFDIKAAGSIRFARALEGIDLDFLLFFSSAQSFAANAGQSNYAAGSTFQDAYALHLAERAPYPVKVVNWGYWGSVGAVADPAHRDRMAAFGLHSIEPEEGVEFLERFRASDVLQAMPLKADRRFLDALGVGRMHAQPSRRPAVQPEEGLGRFQRAFGKLEGFAVELLVRAFMEMGGFDPPDGRGKPSGLMEALGIIPQYGKLYEALVDILERAGRVACDGGGLLLAKAPDPDFDPTREHDRLMKEHPEIASHLRLLRTCLGAYPDILRGRIAATDVMFPDSSMALVEGVYRGNSVTDHFNRKSARAVRDFVIGRMGNPAYRKQSSAGGEIRILEAGAGTGGTTAFVLEEVADLGGQIEYCYSDVSPGFIRFGEERFGRERPFLTFETLNVEKDPTAQGFPAESFDLILAANVLHATRRMEGVLGNLKKILKPGGRLVINEVTSVQDFATMTFGLLDGWWLFEDGENRIPHTPLLSPGQWKSLLAGQGFRIVDASSDGELEAKLGQSVIVAEKTPPRREEKANTEDEWADAARRIVQIVCGLTRHPAETVELDSPFSSVGVDSLMAMEVAREINNTFGAALKTTDLFNYSTPRKLGRRIVETCGGGSPRREASPAPETANLQAVRSISASPVESGKDDIAIIGMAGQFPGADDVDAFWENLKAGRDAVGEIPAGRWSMEGFYDPDAGAANRSSCKWGGFISGIDLFDPYFFHISPREAELMDPQQRLFLMAAHRALESAGYAGSALAGSDCGVFVGCKEGDYQRLLPPDAADSLYLTGNTSSILAARISFFLDLKGPSLAVDTACSSSLTALHLACESLRSGACSMAIAGGVSLMCTPAFYTILSKTGMLSPSGRCRAFSAGADGFAPGEAVAAAVLKPLRDALRDGDHIHAVVKGSAINQDGRTSGITAPSGPSQTSLERGLYRRLGINPRSVAYVEAHGTGTRLGDPMEIDALAAAFSDWTPDKQFCAIGSVKSNIGHALCGAGVAGLVKAVCCLERKMLVPSLHFAEENPDIRFRETPFYVNTESKPWRSTPGVPRRAAISAFGFNGSNAHALLEEAPGPEAAIHPDRRPHLVVLSGRSDRTLRRRAEDLMHWLARDGERFPLAHIAYTLHMGRKHFERRAAFVVESNRELARRLGSFLDGGDWRGEASDPGDVSHKERIETLERLAGRYVHGEGLPGKDFYFREERRIVPAPTGPFELERYWVDAPVVKSPAGATPASPEPETPPRREEACLFLGKSWKAGPGFAPGRGRERTRGHALIIADKDASALAESLARAIQGEATVTGPGEVGQWTGKVASGAAPVDILIDLCDLWKEDAAPCMERIRLLQECLRTRRELTVLHLTGGRSAREMLPSGIMACVVKLLGAEYRSVRARTVDVDLGPEDEARLVSLIRDELASGDPHGEIRHRDGVRREPVLETLASLDRGSIAKTPSRRMPVSPDRAYVVTGGVGGIGSRVARLLVERGARKLVLTGRSPLPPRREWDAILGRANGDPNTRNRIERVRKLEDMGASVALYSGSLTDRERLARFFGDIRGRWGDIGGVVHCAGEFLRSDPAFVHKSIEQMEAVFEPKVAGLIALHQALKDDPLGFFILFSSISASVPALAPGFLDYAAANAFMDAYAERQAALGHGYFKSIDWPSWMGVGKGSVETPRYRELGLSPHAADEGLWMLEEAMAVSSRHVCITPCIADAGRLPLGALTHSGKGGAPMPEGPRQSTQSEAEGIPGWLRKLFLEELKLPEAKLDVRRRFQELGVDSILIMSILRRIEERIGKPVDPNAVFEHPTVEGLSKYLARRFGVDAREDSDENPPRNPFSSAPARATTSGLRGGAKIAVIGMACRFPGADNKEVFWSNLVAGRCGIREAPRSRWDVERFYSPNPRPEKTVSKWGGYIDGIEYFDPEYFGINPDEAAGFDPLIRLFLEIGAETFNDAGYDRSMTAGGAIGVFAGARSGNYSNRLKTPGKNLIGGFGQNFIAARLSHFLDLKGPVMVLDTACSSSLTAIHLACRGIRDGECDMALAGGVDVLLDETPFIGMSQGGALSPDGKVYAFDERANGLVLGEGCGAVLLKSVERAVADGDRIYAVIDSSAVNNDGATMGFTTPDPESQKAVIRRALEAAGASARSVSYVEAHGTGTMIGDPIELKALASVFAEAGAGAGSCAVGSVKTNIGHLLCAAGIASFIKTVLCLRHRQIPPTLHCERPNPRFDFERSPIYPNRRLTDWTPPGGLRRAGVSSFGFGGTNAHIIVSEPDATLAAGSAARRKPLAPIRFNRSRRWIDPGPPDNAGSALLALVDETPGVRIEDLMRPAGRSNNDG